MFKSKHHILNPKNDAYKNEYSFIKCSYKNKQFIQQNGLNKCSSKTVKVIRKNLNKNVDQGGDRTHYLTVTDTTL